MRLASLRPLVLGLVLAPLGLPAQESRWTPPPVLELVSLIGEDPSAAAAKIRGAWGGSALAEGRHLVEQTSFLIAAERDEPLALYRTGGEKVADLARLDEQGLQAYAVDLGNCVEFAFELRPASGEVLRSGELRIEWYPSLIRKTERKSIRVALLGESQDVENQFGHWPLANRQMEAALAFQGYDYRYWWGEGFHGSRHAASMLPEMLRWLWEDVAEAP